MASPFQGEKRFGGVWGGGGVTVTKSGEKGFLGLPEWLGYRSTDLTLNSNKLSLEIEKYDFSSFAGIILTAEFNVCHHWVDFDQVTFTLMFEESSYLVRNMTL